MGSRLSDLWPFIPKALPVYSYGFCMMMGFLTALFLAARRARKVGLSADDILDLAFFAFLAGLVGARVFYVAQFHDQYFGPGRNPWKVFAFHEGGLVFYGGLIAGILVSMLLLYRKHMPVWRTLDVFASVVMVGHAWGRLGCFCRGCCYGVPTTAWWGVVFPPGSPPYDGTGIPWGVALAPVQLLNAAGAFLIFAVTSIYFHLWRRRDGEVSVLLLALYPVERFLLEFWRADTAVPSGLTVAQWISVAMFLCASALFFWMRSRPLPAPDTLSQAAAASKEAEEPAACGRRRRRNRPDRPGR
jgi:phosphatidylglycerol:prolipoprotein diacylglycerol transferase